jgi:hypothetical protein
VSSLNSFLLCTSTSSPLALFSPAGSLHRILFPVNVFSPLLSSLLHSVNALHSSSLLPAYVCISFPRAFHFAAPSLFLFVKFASLRLIRLLGQISDQMIYFHRMASD